MRYCTKCGQPIPDDNQKFCTNCGAPLEPVAGQPAGPADSRPAAASGASAGSDSPRSGLPDQNKKIVILVVVLVVCVLLGALVRVIGRRSKDAVSSTSTSASAAQDESQTEGQTPDSTAAEDSAGAASGTQDGDPWTDGVAPAQPNETQRAEASDTQVVFRNVPAEATLTVDGKAIQFTSVGEDAVVSRDALPDVCIVRAIVAKEGGYQTAAAWYNYRYGNDLALGDPAQYGAYTDCAEDGLCEPSYKVVDVLTWAYYTGYLNCINNQTMAYMAYSTQANTNDQQSHVFSEDNAKNEYNLGNYQAVCEESSIQYSDGLVRYNGSFVTYATNRQTGLEKEISNHRTIELVWEDGMWKVNRMAFLSDEDFSAGRYAQLP